VRNPHPVTVKNPERETERGFYNARERLPPCCGETGSRKSDNQAMALPKDWSINVAFNQQQAASVNDVRAICPHCGTASTFSIRGQFLAVAAEGLTDVHLFLVCNYTACRKAVYVYTTCRPPALGSVQTPDMSVFMYPSRIISSHPSVPPDIADDWVEAQRTVQAAAPKAAAVMLRRVLYGVLIDKGCKLRPLHEGLTALIATCRLPAIFDEWLQAIKDDGHDGAHPDRALQVSPDNVTETMEYTSELLRFLYIEPYEFQQRKSRTAAATATTTP